MNLSASIVTDFAKHCSRKEKGNQKEFNNSSGIAVLKTYKSYGGNTDIAQDLLSKRNERKTLLLIF